MEIIKSTKIALREERKKNERLMSENAQLRADLEFVAIMADVEIPEHEYGGVDSESEG